MVAIPSRPVHFACLHAAAPISTADGVTRNAPGDMAGAVCLTRCPQLATSNGALASNAPVCSGGRTRRLGRSKQRPSGPARCLQAQIGSSPRIVCPMSTFVFHSRMRIPALVTRSRARSLAGSLFPKEHLPFRGLVFSQLLAQSSIGWLRIPASGIACLPTANHRSATLVCARVRL